jgi:hypothetical protein
VATGCTFIIGAGSHTINNLDLSGGGGLTIDAGCTLTITGTFTPGTGTINNLGTIVLKGAAAQTFPGSSAVINNGTLNNLTNLTIDNSNGVSINKSFTVVGTLALTSGTLTVGANTLTLAGGTGTITRTSGLLDASNASAVLAFTNTTALTLPSSMFSGNISTLTVNGAGGVTLGSTITVSTTLNLTAGALDNSTNNITLSNSATITRAAGSLTAAPIFGTLSTHRVNVTISGSVTSGFELEGTTGGIGTLTISSTAVYTYNPTSNITFNTGLTISSTGVGALTISTAKTIIMANGSTITRSGTGTIVNSGNGFQYGTSATDRVNVTISATVTSADELLGTTGKVGTLTCSSGTYTLSGVLPQIDALTTSGGTLQYENTTTVRSLVVVGNVTNTSGTITIGTQGSAVTHTLTIGGNFTRSGTFTVTNGSGLLDVTFNGIANQTISGTAGTVFNNVTVSNSNNAILTVSSTATITSGFTLTVNNGAAMQVNAQITVTGGTALVLNSGSTLYIGTSSFTSGILVVPTSVDANSTIVYNRTTAQSITGSITYGHLTITGTRSSTCDWSSGSVSVRGNFLYDATFSSGSLNMINGGTGSRITFSGASNQTATFNSAFYIHGISNSNTGGVVSFVGSGTITVGAQINANANTTFNFGTMQIATQAYSFSPASVTLTSGNTAVTTISSSLTGVGQLVSGTGIPANTTVIAATGTTLTLSNAATITGASTLTFTNSATTFITTSQATVSSSIKVRTQNTSANPFPNNIDWNAINVTFDGSSNQTIPQGTYRNLTINNSSTIANGSTVTLSSSSGLVTVASGQSLTLNGTINNQNTSSSLFTQTGSTMSVGSTGVYTLSGTTDGQIPIATWNAASTLNVNFTADPASITNRGQTFGIVNWNCTGQTTSFTLGTSSPSSFSTQGLFTISSTGSSRITSGATTQPSMTLGALTISGSSALSIASSGADANRAMVVNGDYAQSGTSTVTLTDHATFTGTLEVKGNFNKSAGTITNSGGGVGTAFIILSGSSPQTFSTNSLTNAIDLTVNNSVGVTLNSTVSLNGNLTLTAGALNNSTNNITVANGANISRAAGSLSAAPVFGASGTDRVSVTITGTCTAGNELAGTTGGIGTLAVNNNATYTLNVDKTLDAISVASGATIDCSTFVLTPRASGSATIAGTFKTANLVGFSGSATAAISSTNSPTFTLTGSTIEYNAASASQIITNRADYNNLTISGGFTKAISASTTLSGALMLTSSSDILSLGSNTLTLNGTVTGSGLLKGSSVSNLTIGGTGALGTLNFDQGTDGTTNVLNDVVVNRSSGTLSLGNKLVVLNSYTPTAGVLTTGGYLHIRSTASNTARIAAGSSGGGYISGDVTVERYLSSNSNRAYRLLTPGVTTASTIRSNWQEGTNNPDATTNNVGTTDYGTHITGTGGNSSGFDVTQNNAASLYQWDQSIQDWVVVTNTNVNTLDAKAGYLIYVRGNRNSLSTLTSSSSSSNTTLRATGSLAQGTQTFSSLAGANNYSLVTNPFAAPVNWGSIYAGANASNFSAYINIWDPNVGTRGGFVTVHPTFGNNNGSSNLTTSLQSGQAFFVQTQSGIVGNPSFTIAESDKTTTNNLDVYRAGLQTEKISIQLKYTANNIDRSADGVVAVFNNNYSNGVDGNDAEQIANWDEDVALLRGGKELSIETRSLADVNDTLFLQIARLKAAQANYRWEIQPSNFNAPGMEAWLLDNYTNTSTQLSLTSNTTVNFTVSSNAASTAANRFKLVFRNNGALPVTITNVKAYQKGTDITVDWTTAKETNISGYEVENSTDGMQFKKMATVTANNAASNHYTTVDVNPLAGNHYYRIKIREQNGSYSYSQIVRVTIGTKGGPEQIVVYPNPVTGSQVNVQLINVKQGMYTLRLIDKQGKVLQQQQLDHGGGSSTQSIIINKGMGNGSYQLELSDGKGFVSVQTILKQ